MAEMHSAQAILAENTVTLDSQIKPSLMPTRFWGCGDQMEKQTDFDL
jgi:hypothetical protein